MADLARIKGNVARMVGQNAPTEDIDRYIASEGVTLDDVRSFKPSDDVAAADARAKAGIAVAQKIMEQGGPDPAKGHDVPAFVSPRAMGTTGTFLSSIGEGVPIVGPYVDKGLTATAAGIGSALTGEPFSKVNDEMSVINDESRAASPVANKLGNVTGAVAGTLPAMAAAPEVFGIGVASAPLRYGASVLSGAAISGGDAAVRSGGDPSAIAWGTGLGLGLGAAAPAIGPLAGRGVKWLADGWNLGGAAKDLGVDKVAAALLSKAVSRDALDEGARDQLAQLGPSGMVMDLGENLRSQAAGLAALPGQGKATVRNAITARDADANWRIRSGLDETLGPAPTPSAIIDRIERSQQAVQPQYRDAFRASVPADTSMVANYLDREAAGLRGEAQRSLVRVRQMLNRTGTDQLETNPAVLLETRKAVDGMLDTVSDTNARNALQTARQAIDDTLRDAAPLVKEADANFAELARQKTALQRGQTVLSSGRESPRPIELAEEVRTGALPQGLQVGPSAVPVRLREGARAEIERIVGTNANDRVALLRLIKGEGDWNRARLSTLFGQDKARAIIDLLDREKLFTDTADQVIRNSHTAARQAAQQELTGSGAEAFGVPQAFMAGGVRGAVRAAGVRGVDAVVEALRGVKSEASRAAMARALASNDPAILDALLRANRGSGVTGSEVDKVTRALLLSAGQRPALPQH